MTEPVHTAAVAAIAADGQLATIASQVNTILIRQSEMAVTLAVMAKTLEDIPDHENRIRALEAVPKVRHDDFKALTDRVDGLDSFRGQVKGAGLVIGALLAIIAAIVGAIVAHILH